MSDILSLDATGQLQALAARRIGAVELLDLAFARRQAVDPQLNAVVAVDLERARVQARLVDEQRGQPERLGLLAGLPMTIKDTFDVDGLPASAGLAPLLKRKAPDAIAVAELRAAGAVIWGKTNVPVMAGDWQSFNAVYGTTNNPWDPARTPGGSSGGAAAALAAGVTALELGSDIGGSLRVPASFCGVYSHKPTWGLVSQRGHIPPRPGTIAETDLNVVGPMARSARDLRLALSVLANGPLAPKAPDADLKALKIGLWLDEPAFALDETAREVLERYARALAREGVQVEPVRPVEVGRLVDAFQTLLGPLIAEGFPNAVRARVERLRPIAKAFGGRAVWARRVLAYSASHREWLAADEVRARMGEALKPVFERFEALIAPATPTPAFPHDHRGFGRRRLVLSDGRRVIYESLLDWVALATVCGLPATTVPAGLTAEGLPVGAQIIGPRGGDSHALSIAQAFEAALGGFVPPEAVRRA